MNEVERIGHADREAAVADLRSHAAAGRISSKEYEDRSLRVGRASTWADLLALFSDLPEPRPRPGAAAGAGAVPPYGTGPQSPPNGSAPGAPPYGDSSSTPTWGTGSDGRTSPSGFGRPPAPYGPQGPVGSPRWGGPFGNGGTPTSLRRRLGPLLPIIVIGLIFAIPHAWFLVFVFPVLGILWSGGGKQRYGGYQRDRHQRRNRRGRDRY